jgi:SAM-dependent methyltransferase
VPQEDHVAAARAVYDASVERYVEFVGTEIRPAIEGPVDHAVLAAFVEHVAAAAPARVADVGCGPGRVAGFLAARGLDVVGLDVSPAMLDAARVAHPGIEFAEGRLDDLPIHDGSLAGVVCWYSIIHTPPGLLGDPFSEIHRVLSPGGYLLLAFQAGSGEPVRRSDAHGTGLPLTSYRHSLEDVRHRLEHAGFEVRATALREAELSHESTPQAFVIARRRPTSRIAAPPPGTCAR